MSRQPSTRLVGSTRACAKDRSGRPDTWSRLLRTAWAERIALRRRKKIAVAALARRLAGIPYAMMRDGTVYRSAPMRPIVTEREPDSLRWPHWRADALNQSGWIKQTTRGLRTVKPDAHFGQRDRRNRSSVIAYTAAS
jgi:hypothetical protein